MVGRLPVPAKLRKLRGNPRQHKMNEKEPQPEICLPNTSDWLDDLARDIFKVKSMELYKVGILTKLDVDILATYCDMLSQYHRLRKQVEDEGFVFYTQKNDLKGNEWMEPKRNPNLVTIENLRREIKAYSSLLGTNPSARVRLQVIDVEEDEFEKFLNKKF